MPEESVSAEPIFHDSKLSFGEKIRQTFRKEPYAADPRAIADSLRSEVSPLTPEQQSSVEATASAINKIIRGKFGRYIPADVMNREVDVEKRIVVVDKDQLIHYEITMNDWDVEPEMVEEEIGPYAGMKDDVIIITGSTARADQVGWREMSEKMKKTLIKANNGNEESARAEGNYRFFLSSLYHEIGHTYQPEDLPTWFREAHAYHLASELYKGYKKDGFDLVRGEGPFINAYQQLLDKYGESVRKMSFGTPIPDNEKKMILRDFKTILKRVPGGRRLFR